MSKATARHLAELCAAAAFIAFKLLSVTSCNARVTELMLKYLGKSLACNLPKTCRGKNLNMVMPATKVVYATMPNHVANESMWKLPIAWAGTCLRGDFEEKPATSKAVKSAKERKAAVLCRRFLVHSVVAPLLEAWRCVVLGLLETSVASRLVVGTGNERLPPLTRRG